MLCCYAYVVCEICIDITTCVFNSYDLSSTEEERDAVRVQKRYMFYISNIISFYFSWISLRGIFSVLKSPLGHMPWAFKNTGYFTHL